MAQASILRTPVAHPEVSAELPKGANFAQFADFLRQTDGTTPLLSPKRFCGVLGMDLQELADQAQVHRNTLTRAPESRTVQAFLRNALKVIKAAVDLSGDLDTALFWYRTDPLGEFDYRTPEQLVAAGRTDDLLDFIKSLEAGFVG